MSKIRITNTAPSKKLDISSSRDYGFQEIVTIHPAYYDLSDDKKLRVLNNLDKLVKNEIKILSK